MPIDEHRVEITVCLPDARTGPRDITFTVGRHTRRLLGCTDDLISGYDWKVVQPLESLGKGYAIEFEWIPANDHDDLTFFEHRVSFKPITGIKR